jgi:uncharacterized membrane protein
MLVVFPIGLWIFSLICDLIYHAGAHNAFWKGVAFYTMLVGVIGALLAAVPGFIDYLSLRDPRIKKIATTHMALNLIVLALFLFNLGIRYNPAAESELLGVFLSIVGIVILAVSGWLGGTLVYIHGVAVAAPSSTEDYRRAA